MYHYTESGLRNIWLVNGYSEMETPEGTAVAISNVESLHKAIGRDLLTKKKLTGAEFRFLRKELGFSQSLAGTLLGVSEQTVAKWEKIGRVTAPAERLMRLIYEEAALDETPHVTMLLEKIKDIDQSRAQSGKMRFEQISDDWKLAA